jgi:hypothetical protein
MVEDMLCNVAYQRHRKMEDEEPTRWGKAIRRDILDLMRYRAEGLKLISEPNAAFISQCVDCWRFLDRDLS